MASLLELEINFDKYPLDQTKILAITGPTGSGKSTVLDAMCLALYDKVPRLLQARDLPGGQEDILGNDPTKTLCDVEPLRRGQKVDFIGADKTKYRSRWELRRARLKADGRIQTQKVKLYQIATEQINELTGATRTETLNLIKEKVGLGFAEFRRAVLLAQGDFAAFLKARSTERATLLEKMTGTELYAQISKAAHSRAKEERENLTQLQNSIEILEVLPEETRQALEEKKANLAQQRTNKQIELTKLRDTLIWYQTEENLKQELSKAKIEQKEAIEEVAKGQNIHSKIKILEYAQQLKKPSEELKTNIVRYESLKQLAQQAEQTLKETNSNCEKYVQLYEASQKAWNEFENLSSQVLEQVQQAKLLDQQIQQQNKELIENRCIT